MLAPVRHDVQTPAEFFEGFRFGGTGAFGILCDESLGDLLT